MLPAPRWSSDRSLPRQPTAILTAILVAAFALAGLLASVMSPEVLAQAEDIGEPCAANPVLFTTCFVRGETFPDEPAIVAFKESDDESAHAAVASAGDVGSAWGLAYHPGRNELYVGAFHKRITAFGPGGPGAVYAIELNTGEIRLFTQVPDAGPDRHDPADNYQPDNAAADWVGKTSLGDIELTPDGTELLVMNLGDRRIHRFSVPDAQPLGSFPHGAASEPWSADARPFGLGTDGDWLFHGVVNSAEATGTADDLRGVVYASRRDGSEMRRVAEVSFDYDRGRHDAWGPWPEASMVEWRTRSQPHPMLTDIGFDHRDNMILGIRDRFVDTGPSLTEVFRVAPGDILHVPKVDDMTWNRSAADGEHYADDFLEDVMDELGLGGLAVEPARDVVVSTVINPFRTRSEGAMWFANVTGSEVAREEIVNNEELHEGPQGKAQGLGDVELACVQQEATETPEPSPTTTELPVPTITPPPPSPTSSPQPTTTPTSVAPTPQGDDEGDDDQPAPTPTPVLPDALPRTGGGPLSGPAALWLVVCALFSYMVMASKLMRRSAS